MNKKAEQKQQKRALMAITAYRQLDGLNLLSDEEKKSIKNKIGEVYGKFLSPLRTEQQEALETLKRVCAPVATLISDADKHKTVKESIVIKSSLKERHNTT